MKLKLIKSACTIFKTKMKEETVDSSAQAELESIKCYHEFAGL